MSSRILFAIFHDHHLNVIRTFKFWNELSAERVENFTNGDAVSR